MRRLRTSVVGIGALACFSLLPGVKPAYAHIGDYYNSVHFASGKPDFGTPPRRAIIDWLGENDDRPVTPTDCGEAWPDRKYVELTENADNAKLDRDCRRRKQLLAAAASDAAKADWTGALNSCQTLGREQQQTDGSLSDRMEALQEARAKKLKQGSPPALCVSRYLHALALDEKDKHAEAGQELQAVLNNPSASFLAPHALYELASIAYEEGNCPKALPLYQKLITGFPSSEKRESSLIMVARCALLSKSARERNIGVGAKALTTLKKAYPKSRFALAAAGLWARIAFLQGQYDQALYAYLKLGDMPSVEAIRKKLAPNNPLRPYLQARLLAGYLRSLNQASDFEDYEDAVADIERTRRSFSGADADRFAQLLRSDVSLTVPYLYYRLYICADEKADYLRLAHMADSIATRYGSLDATMGQSRLAPDVMVRLAETYYQAGDYRKARLWARRALSAGGSDRALFVYGATLQKLQRPTAALAQFNTLMARYPQSPLRRAAREEIAILDESLNDLDGALDQYFALGYDYDIAYTLDARMTPSQVLHYLEAHRHSSRYNLLAYSLGIRYLRDERWQDAELWLHQVPHNVYVSYNKDQNDFDDVDSPKPLVACRDLSRLQVAIGRARTSNDRAAALYRYAGYYYHHGTLLLYNNALWKGDRALVFSFWWNSRVATTSDDNAARRHMYDHDVYARTLALCLQVARQYPRSPSAPPALYRAGCAARKLADMNDWWREEDKHRHFWKQAVSLMRQVQRRYPRSPLVPDARKYAMVFEEELQDPYR